MRILVINTVRFRLNGISAVIMNYYKAMNKENIEMDFVTVAEPIQEYKDMFAQYGITCHVVHKSNLFQYFVRLTKVARKGKYDIAHVHGNSANMAVELTACWLAGIKVRIAHSHNTSTLHPTMHKLLYPLFTVMCTHGFACGEDAGKWLFHERAFTEIKNGIDLQKYQYRTEIREAYRKKINAGERIVLGHVGSIIEQKNHTFLLDWYAELLKENKNYLLLLVGDGTLQEQMEQKARTLGIENDVIFLGKTTEVQMYLQAMDIFVLPSLHEGLPLALVEAQAAGLPCLVADTVARESDITQSMTFLPITDTRVWVNAVLSYEEKTPRAERCKQWQPMLEDAGYDITRNAERMRELYLEYKGTVEQK